MTISNLLPGKEPHSILQERETLPNIHRRINELFDQAFRDFGLPLWPTHQAGYVPRINLWEDDKTLAFQAELPGFGKKEISIELEKRLLVLKGRKEKRHEEKEKEGMFYVREIGQESFMRSIMLPFDADPDTAKADFNNGILTITFQKPKEAREAKKLIPITS